MNKNAKIYIAGHRGLVGSAICRKLQEMGYENLLIRTHQELDLTYQKAVGEFLQQETPDYVFLAAAKVGGILANTTYPAEFIYKNLMIEANIIHAAFKAGVDRLLFLGSSCIYPKIAKQPMNEESLLTKTLEPTNEPYAIAKIAGIKLCESFNRQYGTDYRSVMPTNLYGSGDNYDLETSHVIPALIRKMHLGKCLEQGDWNNVLADLNSRPIHGVDGNTSEKLIIETLITHGIAPASHEMRAMSDQQKASSFTTHRSLLTAAHVSGISVSIWGTGEPRREFLHVDDMAAACVHVMSLNKATYMEHTKPMLSHINVGTGNDCTIKLLAQTIAKVVGFGGELHFDSTKPDGTPRKLLDVSRLKNLGWQAGIELEEGLKNAYERYAVSSGSHGD